MAYKYSVLLDDKKIEPLKGTGLEEKIETLFGGKLRTFILDLPDDQSKEMMSAFDTARIDARGFITDLPVAFNRVLLEEITKAKSLGAEVIDATLKRVSEIKEAAAKESEYIPPPDIDLSDIEELQKTPYQKVG